MSLSVDVIIQGVEDAYTTRYLTGPLFEESHSLSHIDCFAVLSVTGMIMVLYDHVLTISDERELIWKLPHSFPKYAFLFNRYMTPCVMIVMAIGLSYSLYYSRHKSLQLDQRCADLTAFHFLISSK
jgi:hypothetical protein